MHTRRRSRCALLVGRWQRGANPLRWAQRGGEAQAAQKWAWWTLLNHRQCHGVAFGSAPSTRADAAQCECPRTVFGRPLAMCCQGGLGG